jgi:DNA-directed RNA polymerase alpha subunit
MATQKAITARDAITCSVDLLPLSVRAHNVLKVLGIETINDLVAADAKSLLDTPNCGKKTMAEIIACLKMMGLNMVNGDSIFSDTTIDGYIASIQGYLAQTR